MEIEKAKRAVKIKQWRVFWHVFGITVRMTPDLTKLVSTGGFPGKLSIG